MAAFGNRHVIRALWKASSIPANLKKLFLSLASSDLAMGMFAQPMFGVIISVVLRTAANGNDNFVFLCPTVLNFCYFFLFFLASVTFLNVTAIAVSSKGGSLGELSLVLM